MKLTVNSEAMELPDGATVADLLAKLQLPSTRAAVEVDRAIVRRVNHATHVLTDGAVVEVVTLVGGG